MKRRDVFVAAGATLIATKAMSQSSERAVRIIVAFAAGGPVDVMARTIAEPLSKALGRPVIVENRPGANGAIGANEVIRTEPDGNTLWLSSVGAVAINPSLYDKLTYNMQRDFLPVSLVANNVELFVVNPKNTAKDAAEFVANAKQRKDPTPIASSGKGSIPHLALIQLEIASGIDLLHVPYNGMAPALTDLIGGQVEGVFADVPAVMAQVRSGRLKPLGIASSARHPGLPDVKTFEEQGLKAVDTNNWYALFVSSKTSAAIIDQLNKAVHQALADPQARSKILQSGAEPKASSAQELAALLKADSDKWARLIKTRGITLDQ
jgi:tripartite-type tricarboxylate transporter receptor subunit TctC